MTKISRAELTISRSLRALAIAPAGLVPSAETGRVLRCEGGRPPGPCPDDCKGDKEIADPDLVGTRAHDSLRPARDLRGRSSRRGLCQGCEFRRRDGRPLFSDERPTPDFRFPFGVGAARAYAFNGNQASPTREVDFCFALSGVVDVGSCIQQAGEGLDSVAACERRLADLGVEGCRR